MKQLGSDPSRLVANDNGQKESRNKHGHAQQPKLHCPAHVLYKPKDNVHVFCDPESPRNGIDVLVNVNGLAQGSALSENSQAPGRMTGKCRQDITSRSQF